MILVRLIGRPLGISLLGLLLALALPGCGKKTPSAAALNGQAFGSAPPEIKQQWDAVTSAATTNGYAVVILTCRALLANQALTPEQREAVINIQTATNNKMFDAVQHGDTAAQEELSQVRQGWR